MATTARAAVFFGPGKPFEIKQVPIPEIEPDGVLIRVTHANICGSDLHFWRGDAPLRLPDDGWIFGHEMTGRVARLGARVKTDSLGRALKEGDRVAYTYFYPCGRCYACVHEERAACPNKIERPLGPSAPPHSPRRLRRPLLPPPGRRAVHGARRALRRGGGRGELRALPGLLRPARGGRAPRRPRGHPGRGRARHPGRRGGQGHGGGDRDRDRPDPGRLELARAFGADHTINVKEVTDRRERVKLVRQWTGGVGADVACDLVGFPAVIPEGIEMLRSGGTYLEIGTISRGAKIELEPSLLVWGSKKIVGVIQYEAWVIPRALDFLVRTRERYPWGRILSHKYPLEQINEAFAASEWHNRETTTITRAALTP